jgi:hypothetical protein
MPMDDVQVYVEVGLGAALMVGALLIHGLGMYLTELRFEFHLRRGVRSRLALQGALGVMILMLMFTHLVEIYTWGAMLHAIGAVANLRDAIYFAAACYTTLGFGEHVLPDNWRLLAPIMAMSGMFAFGWTTGVLVTLVARGHALVAGIRSRH